MSLNDHPSRARTYGIVAYVLPQNKAREAVKAATDAAKATPKGHKKQVAGDEMSSYHPEYVEAAW